MPRLLPPLSILMALIAGCTDLREYDITLNDRPIYRPASLFSDYAVSDPALAICIEQMIEDQRAETASQLAYINCSNAGIRSLDGLGTFIGLEAIKLSGNRIRNLVEVGQLRGLVELYLDDNQIVDAVPLTNLQRLKKLDLSANDKLQCHGLKRLDAGIAITAPEHCRES